MSTKTLRKRIALVAVSAMAFGLLSNVSANAVGEVLITQDTPSAGSLAVVTALSGSAGAKTATITSSGALALAIAGSTAAATGRVTVSGGYISKSTSTTAVSSDLTMVDGIGLTGFTIVVKPNSGSSTITVKTYDTTASITAGTPQDKATISVVAPTSVGVFSASKSFAKLTGTAAGSASDYVDQIGANVVANGSEGLIDWSVRDGNSKVLSSSSIITVSATNGALVGFSSGSEIGSSTSQSMPASGNGTVYVAQPTANASVSTVVTITVDGVAFTTKSLTIVGDVAKITLSKNIIGQKNGTGSFYASVYDGAGNRLAVTPTSDGTRYNASLTSITAAATSTTADTLQTFSCSSTPGTGKASFTYTNSSAVKIVSNDLDLACAGNPYTFTAALDKSSYAPGDVATLTITAKDSKGNLTNGTAALGSSSYPVTIAGGQMTPVTTPTNADTFTSSDGTKTYKFTVGTTEGSYNMVVDLPYWEGGSNSSSATQTAQTVSYSVKSNSAAVSNADVLAAIVKLIASINKQIAALQKALMKK